MVGRVVLLVALIAGVTTYAIAARSFRHQELVARTIAYGARRRATEHANPGLAE